MAIASEALKIERLKAKVLKKQNEDLLIRQLIASPIVQLIGTVLIAETAEKSGLLTPRWAGALEGGVIAMVGIQALKDSGILGLALMGGLGIGASVGDMFQSGSPIGTAIDIFTGKPISDFTRSLFS